MFAIPKVAADVLRVAAPTLLAGLSGPLAPVAAAVATAALNGWLGPPPPGKDDAPRVATPGEIAAAVQEHAGEPDFVRELRRAELDAQRYEAESGIAFAKIEAQDRADARGATRDTGLARPQFYAGMALVAVSLLMLFGVVAGCVMAITGNLGLDPAQAQIAIAAFGLIGTVVGIFQAVAIQVLGFYFGSSAGSREKTDQLGGALQDLGAALADKAAAPAPPPPPPPVVAVPPVAPVPAPVPDGGAPRPSRFIGLVDRLLGHEGGYSDHPADNGRCTNFGITIGTLGDWRGEAVTCDDVRALPRAEAKEIYYARYWNALRCDELPPGVDWIVFDFGVNAGVGRAARTLQRILAKRDPSLKVDGVVGPLTVAAMAKASPRDVVEEFHEERMRHYRGLSTWGVFGTGWTRRAESVLADARAAVASGAVPLAA